MPDGEFRVFTSNAQGGAAGLSTSDRAAALELDRRVTGEDREAAVDLCRYVAFGDAVAMRPPWRALPIVGAPDDAEVLLRELVEPGLRLAAPTTNERAMRVLEELGTEREGVVRMRLGPPVDWRPTEVWGVFSLFFG